MGEFGHRPPRRRTQRPGPFAVRGIEQDLDDLAVLLHESVQIGQRLEGRLLVQDLPRQLGRRGPDLGLDGDGLLLHGVSGVARSITTGSPCAWRTICGGRFCAGTLWAGTLWAGTLWAGTLWAGRTWGRRVLLLELLELLLLGQLLGGELGERVVDLGLALVLFLRLLLGDSAVLGDFFAWDVVRFFNIMTLGPVAVGI